MAAVEDPTGRWRATSESLLRVGLVVWPALVVLAVDPGGLFPFGPARWLVVSAGVPVLLALATRRMLVVVPAVQWLSVATIAAMALAALVAGEGWLPWIGTEDRHFGVLTWVLCAGTLLVGQSLAPGALEALWWGVSLAGFGLGAVATAEALGWEPLVLAVDDRLTATMGSAAYLGAATALLLPAVIALAVQRRGPRPRRLLSALAVPLLLVAAIGSGARAAWFGLAVASVVVVAVNGRTLVAWVRHRPRLAASGASLAILAVVVVLVATPAGARLGELRDGDRPGGASRVDEWRVAVAVAAHHPLIGVGPEGYRVAYVEGLDDEYARAHGRDVGVDRAHAGPLDVALSGGLVALAAWLAWLAATARFVGRGLRAGRSPVPMAGPVPVPVLGLAAGVIAYLAAQLMLFPLSELDPLAWLLAGAVVGATARTSEVRQRVVGTWSTAIAAAVAAVAILAGTAAIVADHRASEAVEHLYEPDPAPALAAIDAAIRLRPDSVRLHLFRADIVTASRAETTGAIAAVDDALAIAPGDPILERLRVRYLAVRAQGTQLPADIDAARTAIDERLAVDAHDPSLWLLASQVAVLDGDRPAARADLDRVEALDPGSPEARGLREQLDGAP